MRTERHNIPKLEFQKWKNDVDELCQKLGIALIINEYDDTYWLKKFENCETPGDIVLEWSMKK
jgi:predicted adenine nucleotide alpha hydrolase (AANH) superfamily ATPase